MPGVVLCRPKDGLGGLDGLAFPGVVVPGGGQSVAYAVQFPDQKPTGFGLRVSQLFPRPADIGILVLIRLKGLR